MKKEGKEKKRVFSFSSILLLGLAEVVHKV
jgi:hypothetical protein